MREGRNEPPRFVTFHYIPPNPVSLLILEYVSSVQRLEADDDTTSCGLLLLWVHALAGKTKGRD